MRCDWRIVALSLALVPGIALAHGPDATEIRRQIEAQQQQIEMLRQQVDAAEAGPKANPVPAPAIDTDAVQKIVGDYLKDHPGAGMPSGVQTGWSPSKGFFIDTPPNPTYTNWQDESRIPFELRIRGRIQADYHFYKVTDNYNHLAGLLTYDTPTHNTANANGNPTSRIGANSTPDFFQEELKRVRLIFEGTAFDPDLRYNMTFDGGTRGINGLTPATFVGTSTGGAPLATVDHGVRMLAAFVAYDWHPCCTEKGCGVDCCDGSYQYRPTVTFIAGKFKSFYSFEEILGNSNQQFVEYGMAEWFFDADDDNSQTQAGVEAKLLEDRMFIHATINNSNETQTSNLNNQRLPAFNVGGWYDFGGSWNEERKRWDLYGDCASDLDYSCKPVLRAGAITYISPMDRKSEYGSADIVHFRAAEAAPGTSNAIVNVISGIDKFDSYSFEAFWAGKYRGFSFLNDWWVRDINNIQGVRNAFGQNTPITYTTYAGVAPVAGATTGVTALFPKDHALVDYGMNLQGGYFIVPKKLEVVARRSFVSGDSGNINGNGTATILTAAQAAALGVPAGTRIVNGAFTHDHESDEYAIGVNYYWKRQLFKWQTDLSFYRGGNPAFGSQSPAGTIPGVDGYLLRTAIQLMF
jgi:hypothetical protein